MTVSPNSFLSDFTNLRNYDSILEYAVENFLEPYTEFIGDQVDSNPFVIRVTGPFVGVSVGITMLAISVANLVEGIFKGFTNFLIGAFNLDKSRMFLALKMQLNAIGVLCAVIPFAAINATIGSIGLIIAPQWSYDHIINL